jgi:hypothetical protein
MSLLTVVPALTPVKPIPAAARGRRTPERRSNHPIDRLSREIGSVCTTAVHPLEIAAVLESQGFTDAACRDFYDCDDVFDLAERLWARTPAVVPEAPAAVVDRPGSVRDLLHGIIVALNGVFFTVGLRSADDPRAVTALVISLVIGWAGGQASALLWFRVGPRNGDEAARTVLRRSLLLALAGGLVFGWVGDHIGLPAPVTLMGVSQLYLVMAASALLLYRRELWFFLALVPATTAVVASVAAPESVDAERVLAVVIGSVLVIVAAAALLVRPVGRGPQRAGIERGWDLTLLPLVLTIGVAEWQLRSYRRQSSEVLGVATDVARFGTITWRLLIAALLRYLIVLSLVTVVLWGALLAWTGEVPAETTLLAVAYVVLGGALFLNLVLIAHGRVDLALRAMVAGATAYGIVLAVQTSIRSDPQTLAALYLALCAGLLVSLLLATRAVVRQPLLH